MGELHGEPPIPPIGAEHVTAQEQVLAVEPSVATEGGEILSPGSLGVSIQAEQKRRSLVDRLLPRFKTVRALALAAGLATGVAACGGSASSANKVPTRATVTTPRTTPKSTTSVAPSTTTTLPPTPTEHYIALCDGLDIEYVDPADGKILKTISVYSNFDTFTPSIRYDSNASSGGDTTCGQWSYNGTLTEISGLDTEKTGTVPAIYNLLTSKITDLVAPPPEQTTTTTTPFAAQTTPPPSYVGTYFDPVNQDMYWIESLDGGNINKLVGKTGVLGTYGFADCAGATVGITFPVNSTTPVAGCAPSGSLEPNNQASQWQELQTQAEISEDNPKQFLPEQQSQFGLNFQLPDSNYYWNVIRRSDDGKMAAFVGYKSAQDQYDGPFVHSDCTLFTVSVESGSPQGITQLPSCGSPYTYGVIRYVP